MTKDDFIQAVRDSHNGWEITIAAPLVDGKIPMAIDRLVFIVQDTVDNEVRRTAAHAAIRDGQQLCLLPDPPPKVRMVSSRLIASDRIQAARDLGTFALDEVESAMRALGHDKEYEVMRAIETLGTWLEPDEDEPEQGAP